MWSSLVYMVYCLCSMYSGFPAFLTSVEQSLLLVAPSTRLDASNPFVSQRALQSTQTAEPALDNIIVQVCGLRLKKHHSYHQVGSRLPPAIFSELPCDTDVSVSVELFLGMLWRNQWNSFLLLFQLVKLIEKVARNCLKIMKHFWQCEKYCYSVISCSIHTGYMISVFNKSVKGQ